MTKPKVHIDQDGDGDVDVTVEVDTPAGGIPDDLREALVNLVARMEVHITPPTVRITYSGARETLRGLID